MTSSEWNAVAYIVETYNGSWEGQGSNPEMLLTVCTRLLPNLDVGPSDSFMLIPTFTY